MKTLFIVLAFFLLLATSCPSEFYPHPPYPNPDTTIEDGRGIWYFWRCYEGEYVTVVYYLVDDGGLKWREVETRGPGMCIH